MKEDRATILKSRIDRVLWGKTVANVLDGTHAERSFILRSLTIGETNLVENIYNQELNRALKAGMKLEEDLIEMYQREELWTPDDDIYVTGLERKIEIIEDQIENQYAFMTSRKKKAKRELKRTEEELEEKRTFRRELFAISAENRADEIKRRNMVFLSTQSLDESQYWDNFDTFLRERDFLLVFNLGLSYYKHNILETPEVREIARDSMWRYRWNMAKNGADMFGRSIADWSESQSALVYWSQYYDFIMDSPDRPNDAVIDDDAECDKWYKDQIKKMKTSRAESNKPARPKRGGPKKFHQEQFVMVERGDTEAVREVQEMNSELVRAQLRSEQKDIKTSKGRVKEWDLRKNQYMTKRM